MSEENLSHLPLGSSAARPRRDEREWVTGPELCDEAGITYRQLDYWTRAGLLATITDPVAPHRGRYPRRSVPGSGHLRRYTEAQVTRAHTIRLLLDAGVSLAAVGEHIDQILAAGYYTAGPVRVSIHCANPYLGEP